MGMNEAANAVCDTDGLICFWDFQEQGGQSRKAQGPYAYGLAEGAGAVERAEDGIFGPYAADVKHGQWFSLPRAECPALDIHGPAAQVTIAAWLKWADVESKGCQDVAGIWNESRRKRQYCLFLDLRIWQSKGQACGHVSSVGGPTPGHPYCMTSAIGNTPLSKAEWHFVVFTYDGGHAKIYLDGLLDAREHYNPFEYPEGLFDGGAEGADFTVGAVDRSGEMGNFYTGLLGGLAVYNRAITAEEIAELHARTMSVPSA